MRVDRGEPQLMPEIASGARTHLAGEIGPEEQGELHAGEHDADRGEVPERRGREPVVVQSPDPAPHSRRSGGRTQALSVITPSRTSQPT